MNVPIKDEIFNFPIARVAQFVLIGTERIYSGLDAIVRLDTRKVLGHMSAKVKTVTDKNNNKAFKYNEYYKEVTHSEVVAEARKALRKMGVKPLEFTFLLSDGAVLNHYFDTKIYIEPIKDEKIYLRLKLFNSYNKATKCGWVLYGVKSDMSIATFTSQFFEVKKHSGSFILSDTIELVKKSIKIFKHDVKNTYNIMAESTISVRRGVDIIKSLVASKLIPEKYGEYALDLWKSSTTFSYWSVYLCLIHGVEFVSSLDRKTLFQERLENYFLKLLPALKYGKEFK